MTDQQSRTRLGERRKKPPVPVFSSPQEEAEFWDTHDSMDYEWEDVPEVVARHRQRSLNIWLAPETIEELKRQSAKTGLEPTMLARILIVEGLAARKSRTRE